MVCSTQWIVQDTSVLLVCCEKGAHSVNLTFRCLDTLVPATQAALTLELDQDPNQATLTLKLDP